MNTFRLCIVVAGLHLATAFPSQAADHQIGALFPLSGPNATYGDIFMSGADLAVDHINADELLSGELSLRYEDSQALPQRAVVGMTKLVNVDQVPYVLSAFTGVSKAISTLAQRNQVVAVNGGGVGPDLAQLGEYFWNVIPLANLEVRGLVPYLVEEEGLKNVVLIYVDDPLGQAIRTELETELPTVGGTLVDALSVPTTAQQFSGIAAKVRAAEPDAVYIASYGAQQLQIVKQLRDNGVDAQLVTYSGYSVSEALALPESEGLIYTTQSVDYDSDDPVTKRFVDDYTAKYGRAPTAYNVNYYNAVRLFGLLAHALEDKGQAVTGANLLAERMATDSFDLVGGTVSFQDDGTLVAPIQINIVTDGAGQPVATVDVAD
ncbi:ABC transporter substrate-binding protein [Rhodospira trueperi]|uniref:ABC-type branched-chain amino acid transport system, substrate-binding protein n=1 Tax=Rhodospira trueperi TaxID=69960 RepID=A0A1G7GG26_9PROT|nr:ABC transporter substrate-binding protein [Rhodospira trueperi]SDE87098.1 ABC-type branched-chain amino acid transport system, substrate-binding protein [Rhodospira trueperi]